MKQTWRACGVALVLAVSTLPAATPQLTAKVTLVGNDAGVQTVQRRPDGSLAIHFEFTDRGRGPKIDAVYRLGEAGLPVEVVIDGNEYFKGAVAERFTVRKGLATWKNRGEHGELLTAKGAPGAFYVAYDSPPEETAMLAAALLKIPDRKLALLPAGEASAEVVETQTLRAADGSEVQARLVELHGLDFAPSQVWIDADGALVAQVSPWLTVIRSGFEGSAADLQKAQDARNTARYRRLAAELPHRPEKGLVIRHARLLDSEAKQVREGWSVLIQGERIVTVGPDADVLAPDGAETLDATGKTLLPGLWDMHTHLSAGDGLLHLASGVLNVRDMANTIEIVGELKRQWEGGETLGPRAVLAGMLDGPGPYAGPTKALVSSFEEARPWIDRYAALGYVQVKLYSSIKPELVVPIAAYAHSKGMRVSGHIPAFMTAEQAIRAGYDEIQHANMLVLNFLFDEVKDTRTPARFTAVAEHAASLDLDSASARAFFDLLAERGIVLDPTLSIFDGMFTAVPGEVSPDFAAVADRLPPLVRRGFLGGGLPMPEGGADRYRASFKKMQQIVLEAWKRGIRIVPGTDSLAGFSLHRELELYAEAGIPNLDVLSMATLGAAQIAGRAAISGSIRQGKLADLVLVAGAPDRRMRDIRNVDTVIKGGAVLDPAALDRVLGVKPATAAP